MSSVAIKISADLAAAARAASTDADRSLTGQVEHWARLGKAVEPVLSSVTIALLKKSGGDLGAIEDETERARVLSALAMLRKSPPYPETRASLAARSTPLYEADPENPSGVVLVAADGKRTPGRVIDRVFVPAS